MKLLHSNTETEGKRREKSEETEGGCYQCGNTAGKRSRTVILSCMAALTLCYMHPSPAS